MKPMALVSLAARTIGASLLSAAALAAQSGRSTLSVSVADAGSGTPIVGAEVFLPELKLLQRTDSVGRARIGGVPGGMQRIRVRLIGYAASDTTLRFAGDTILVEFHLARSAVPVGGVSVTAAVPRALKDFESRRKQGIGRFLTETDLSRDSDRDFTLVASMRFPGLTMQTDTDGRPHIAGLRSSCGGDPGKATTDNRGVERIGGKPGMKDGLGARGIDGEPRMTGSCENMRPCLVPIYLDNIEMGEADAGLIRTWDLSGAEYYTGNTVPARYRKSGSACGVLLLWSKWS